MTDYLGWRDIVTDPVLCLEVGLAAPFRPLTDGIPNVLVEAMAMEVPVVSTFVAGIPELIEDGRTGSLVPEKDPAALATAIERLMRDPAGAPRAWPRAVAPSSSSASTDATISSNWSRSSPGPASCDPERHALHDAATR